jgi:hypothetical protein
LRAYHNAVALQESHKIRVKAQSQQQFCLAGASNMKTKPFLLATAGSTVDGRVIDAKNITEMASAYDPKTYTARVNIEHIRGISPTGDFGAYGDVLELSVADVTVNFNGTDEVRTGLYGVLDVGDNAKALNNAGQKVYPSIEIIDNFGGKGFAYLAGVALTDSPASIATERLQFNRRIPGSLELTAENSGIAAAALEFAPDAPLSPEAKGMFSAITDLLKNFTQGNKAPEPITPPEKTEGTGGDFAAFGGILTAFAQKMDDTLTAHGNASDAKITALSAKLTKLTEELEASPASYSSRPPSDGGAAHRTDC